MKTYTWKYNSTFFASGPDGVEWSASGPCRFTPKERASHIHWIIGWVGTRVSLEVVERGKKYTDGNLTRAVQPVSRLSND
jgi:hypothetical protein